MHIYLLNLIFAVLKYPFMKDVVLITGATSGIGRATAELLSQKGYRVYGTARHIQAQPEGYTLLTMDVRDTASVAQAVERIITLEKRIDVLINNAGVSITGAIEETPIEALENAFQTNVFGAIRVIQAVLPYMRAQQKGKVINITSVAAYMGLPFRGGYSASKGALQLLSESLRMETEQFGICFCTLAPGDVATDIASRRFHTPALEGSPYKQYAEALPLMNADVDNGLPAQDLAQAIYSLLQKEHPKVHYIKGKALERLSVFLKKILPSKCFERLLKRHYRL